MTFLQFFIFCVFIATFLFWWDRRSLRKYADKISGPKGLPLIGFGHINFLTKGNDIYSTYSKLADPFKSGKLLKTWIGPMLWVFCINPEDTKTILNSYLHKPKLFYDAMFRNGLISMNGEKYKEHRKAITPLFTPKALKNFLPLIEKAANEFFIKFDSELQSDVFDLSHGTMDFVLNSSLKTFLGVHDVDEETRKKFLHHVDGYFTISASNTYKPWMKLDKYFKFFKSTRDLEEHTNFIYQLLETFIVDHESEFQEETPRKIKNSRPFLDNYYTLRHKMTFKETIEGFFMFYSAAFVTTGGSIPSVLLLLAMNPHEQDKVHDEVASILSSEFEKIDEEKISKMIYLDLVIKETLRLMPQALIYLREATDNVELSTCTVPKGATMFIWPMVLHTKKEYWGDDVMEFKPDRFREENICKVHPYAYVPFSGGSRICPGIKYANLTMKMWLSKFLLKYRVTTELKYEELEFEFAITSKVKQGYMMKVERR